MTEQIKNYQEHNYMWHSIYFMQIYYQLLLELPKKLDTKT